MNGIGLLIVTLVSLIVVAQAYGVDMEIQRTMIDWVTVLAKATGASIGSAIAVVFNSEHESTLKIVQRFVIGAIIGFTFSPVFRDWAGWPYQFDYWMASAIVCGCVGYLTLQILYSRAFKEHVFGKLARSKR